MDTLALGGMAEVFRARAVAARDTGPDVALKVLLPGARNIPGAVDGFAAEARVLSRLNHPNVIRCLAHGTDGGRPYMVLEMADGPDVLGLQQTAAVHQLRLPTSLCVAVAVAALQGLHHAHEARDEDGRHLGLIHRDVSPDNIFTMLNGQVKVGDFGIAKLAALDQFTDPAFGIRGKLGYLAPERLRHEPFDARADQFSLALVLYEMCTGQRPYAGDEQDVALIRRIRDADIPEARKAMPEVPPRLSAVIMKALEAKPRKRFESCAAFAAALAEVSAAQGFGVGPQELRAWLQELYPDRYPRAGSGRARML
jgi:serine/threonine protein kinase